MNLLNINVPKDSISMIFDAFGEIENCNTTLYLHKSNLIFEDNEDVFAKLELDLSKNIKNDKMIKRNIASDYGTYLLTFLNANFSNSENAYNTFFVYYGLEGLNNIDMIKEKYSKEHTVRYVSTRNFLNYYNKAYDLVKNDYIKFQTDIRKTVDFVYNLHESSSLVDMDKYSKFTAYASMIKLVSQFNSKVNLGILDTDSNEINEKNLENMVKKISNKKLGNPVVYIYNSTSHLTLIYISLNDLVQNSKRNLSICQNCGRYYLQYSGKEVYCDLPNLDGNPTCKTFASRKAYDNKITEDIAELAYKREYQRRITQVYRTKEDEKDKVKKAYNTWKNKARKQLQLYREGKISSEEFCSWIEENK